MYHSDVGYCSEEATSFTRWVIASKLGSGYKHEISVPSSKFFHQPKTALATKALGKKKLRERGRKASPGDSILLGQSRQKNHYFCQNLIISVKISEPLVHWPGYLKTSQKKQKTED